MAATIHTLLMCLALLASCVCSAAPASLPPSSEDSELLLRLQTAAASGTTLKLPVEGGGELALGRVTELHSPATALFVSGRSQTTATVACFAAHAVALIDDADAVPCSGKADMPDDDALMCFSGSERFHGFGSLTCDERSFSVFPDANNALIAHEKTLSATSAPRRSLQADDAESEDDDAGAAGAWHSRRSLVDEHDDDEDYVLSVPPSLTQDESLVLPILPMIDGVGGLSFGSLGTAGSVVMPQVASAKGYDYSLPMANQTTFGGCVSLAVDTTPELVSQSPWNGDADALASYLLSLYTFASRVFLRDVGFGLAVSSLRINTDEDNSPYSGSCASLGRTNAMSLIEEVIPVFERRRLDDPSLPNAHLVQLVTGSDGRGNNCGGRATTYLGTYATPRDSQPANAVCQAKRRSLVSISGGFDVSSAPPQGLLGAFSEALPGEAPFDFKNDTGNLFAASTAQYDSQGDWDVLVIAHELSHNLGSGHTHDCSFYSPPIDQCGASPSCGGPACTIGSISSYCHMCGYGSVKLGLHPRTASAIRRARADAGIGCSESCAALGGKINITGVVDEPIATKAAASCELLSPPLSDASKAACSTANATCEASCSGPVVSACFCDFMCAIEGDCCCDACAATEPSMLHVPTKACG